MKIEKLRKLYLEIASYSYIKIVEIKDWNLETARYEGFNKYAERRSFGTISPGAKWGKTGETGFFSKLISVSEEYKGYGLYLEVVTGGEAQLFIDNRPYQGNDPNHYRVLLTEEAKGNESFNINIESFVRISQNAIGETTYDKACTGEFMESRLCAVDLNAQEFLWDIEFAIEYAETHKEYTYRLEEILSKLFTSFDIMSKQSFLDYVSEGRAFLSKDLDNLGVKQEEFTVWMIGQSHLDLAWFWRKGETYRKVVRTFSSVLRNMEQYDFYQFMMPQVKLHKMLKEAAPEVFEEVRQRVKEGKFEIVGQMYVEPDTNLVAGEWIVRQILLGRRFYKDEFGRVPKVESLIDAFGYSGNIPQLLKKSGMDSVMVTKMMWYNDTNKFPYSAFIWKGIDGSEVLSATMPWFNRPCTNEEVKNNLDRNNQKNLLKDIPVFYGWGDGGGGADENHLKGLKRLMKWHKHAKVKTATMEEYFENLKRIKHKLPSWWGEIYQEGHRGCYTSQARNKKFNRESEALYRALEFIAGFNIAAGGKNEYEKLKENIELMLINQFHDILPGSAASKVYEDSWRDYDKILSEGKAYIKTALETINKNINTTGEGIPIIIWNFNGSTEYSIVNVQWNEGRQGTLINSQGSEIPFIVENNLLTFTAKDLPSFGYKIYRFVETNSQAETIYKNSDKNFMENHRYKIRWDNSGNLTEIFDKLCERQLLKEGTTGNRLIVYFDYPLNCDAWDIDSDYTEKFEILEGKVAGGLKRDNLKQWITVSYQYGNSTIEQDIIIYSDDDKIQFSSRVDWQESHKLLKANFDFDINTSKACYDIPFGIIERDTHKNNSYQRAQFEVPAISFADLSEGNYGAALISPHKNGFSVEDSSMGISLLRSPKFPDTTADQGCHEFTYYLIGHKKDFRDGNIVHQSRVLLYPPIGFIEDCHYGQLEEAHSFLSVDKPNVIIEALKEAEYGEGLILRVFETYGQQEKVNLGLNLPVKIIQECTLVEEVINEVQFKDKHVTFTIKPYEIKTFRLII